MYEVFVQYAWPPDTVTAPNKIVNDYTVRVYAAEKVRIINDAGQESVSGGHDKEFWPNYVLEQQQIALQASREQKRIEMRQMLLVEIYKSYSVMSE